MFRTRFFKIFFPIVAVLLLFFGLTSIFGMPDFIRRAFVPQPQSVEEIRELAEQGDMEAQRRMARFYRNGSHDFPQDYEQAYYWYSLAAAQGHPEAQNNLGTFYSTGNVVERNHERANYWFRLAAVQDLRHAQKNWDFSMQQDAAWNATMNKQYIGSSEQ